MKLFTSRAKLLERLISLEDHIGAAYVSRDGYHEHINNPYGELPKLIKQVEQLQKKGKK